MSDSSNPRWVWEPTDPSVSGSSGDISKLFRNEVVKNPGIFAAGAPSNVATLMAREVIQNSADAAEELREALGEEAPEFEMEFSFSSLAGDEKRDFVSTLDLGTLAGRSESGGRELRAQLGLSSEDCLSSLANSESPLPILKIEERGTTGMYGPFEDAKSKMYLALISLGYTVKANGSGGSYGYGKAGLIRGSKVRAIVAYTCFQERPEEPGVTRRLLGMTYWGQHEADGRNFTGFARLGDEDEAGKVRPLVNEDADRVAAELGMRVRDPSDLDDLGTTFLLVDPAATPEDLVKAIERNWWPAIEDGMLTAIVNPYKGSPLVPRPFSNEVLRPFLEAYRLALSPPDNRVPEKKRSNLSDIELSTGEEVPPGCLGMVADLEGWSFAVDDTTSDEPVRHKSLVALLRKPKMIVEYLEAGSAKPYVRGAFVADEAVNELLRQSEPKAHDAWQTRIEEGGIDPESPHVAKAVLFKIKNNLNQFRNSLKPPPRPAEDIRLPELEKLWKSIAHSKGREKTPPPPGDRPFSIRVNQELTSDSERDSYIRLRGSVSFALIDESKKTAFSEVSISFRFLEEGGAGEEAVMTVSAPQGFERVSESPYVFRGVMDHDGVVFTFESQSYPSDWSGKLKANAIIPSTREAAEVGHE